jgi:hypothetical protein
LEADAAEEDLPPTPARARIQRPSDALTSQEIELRERLQAQPHPNTEPR